MAKIRSGTSITRNPILVSLAAQGLLPYRGLGTGIRRALVDWPAIEFTDDRDGNQFTVKVYRQGTAADVPTAENQISTDTKDASTDTNHVSTDTEGLDTAVLRLLSAEPNGTARGLGEQLGKSTRTMERLLVRLQEAGRLRRVGPRKGGHWEVLDGEEE